MTQTPLHKQMLMPSAITSGPAKELLQKGAHRIAELERVSKHAVVIEQGTELAAHAKQGEQ